MRDLRLLPSLEGWPRLQQGVRAGGYSLQQLLEKRLGLFVLVDVFFVGTGLMSAMIAGARLDELFTQGVLYPSLLLGISGLAGVVAIERRSGSLDLALAVPSTERFFLRRMLPLLLFLTAQGMLVLALGMVENAGSLSKLPGRLDVVAEFLRAAYQTVQLHAFLLAVAFFWAVRLQTAGGVAIASIATVGAFWPWLNTSPRLQAVGWVARGPFGVSELTLRWLGHAVVLGLATLLFYLYARARVRRPESMLN